MRQVIVLFLKKIIIVQELQRKEQHNKSNMPFNSHLSGFWIIPNWP